MKLYFFDLNQYSTFKQAKDVSAVRELRFPYVANPNLRSGALADTVWAITSAATMVDGHARVRFVLVTDDDQLLDVL